MGKGGKEVLISVRIYQLNGGNGDISVICGLLLFGDSNAAQNYTSIKTDGGCKLYMKNIKFSKSVIKGLIKEKSDSINIEGGSLKNVTGTCTNRAGTIELVYGKIEDDQGKVVIDELKLTWDVSYSPQSQWWTVESLELNAKGALTDQKQLEANWSGSLMQSVGMGAPKMFGYVCSKPYRLTYTTEDTKKTIFGLQFENIHLQPFEWNRGRYAGGFTDNVDDCVAFLSAGVWMSIITGLLLLFFLLFGLVMMGNMNTVNRFDDPKGPNLMIVDRG